jgi:hypothetical protein
MVMAFLFRPANLNMAVCLFGLVWGMKSVIRAALSRNNSKLPEICATSL